MVRPLDDRLDRPRPEPAPKPPQRGATRAQYLLLLLLLITAFALTAILLWTRLAGDSSFAVTWLI